MKLTRKLIPAVAMLIISAVMMSTASFAWFTTNTSVDVNGVNITAVAPVNLSIAKADSDKWANSITSTADATLDPASILPVPGAAFNSGTTVFYAAEPGANFGVTGGVVSDTDYKTNKFLTVDASGVNTGHTYFIKDSYKLMVSPAADVPVYVKGISVSSTGTATGTATLLPAIRVAIVVNGQLFGVYASAATAYKPVASIDETSKAATLSTTAFTPTVYPVTSSAFVEGTTPTFTVGGTAVNVDLYFWIEGQDAACINANAKQSFGATVIFGTPTE